MSEKWFVRFRFHLIGIFIIVLLWVSTCLYVIDNSKKDQQSHFDSERLLLEGEIDSIINTYEEFGTYIFEQVIHTPEVLELMSEASTASESERTILRSELYALLEKDYERILCYDFKQLQFHFANGDSFLRFNAPTLYGDNLFSIRESIRLVNTNQKPVFGFEEGRLFNGYRMVFPLFYEESNVGSVEVAVSLNGVIKLLRDTYPSNNLFYILKRDVIEGASFKEQQDTFVHCGISDTFLIDREIANSLFDIEKGTAPYNQKDFIAKMKQQTESQIALDQPFSFTIIDHNSEYLVQFLPILNVSNKPVGYFISTVLDDHARILQAKNLSELLLIALVFVFMILLLFIYFHEKKQAQRRASVDALTQIFNRLKFTELANREMSRSVRYQNDLSILFFDLDDFKRINDTYGHSVGDVVLKSLVDSIKPHLRDSDIFARWGGEEFLILMPETETVKAMILAERIRQVVEKGAYDLPHHVTISIGVSERRSDDTEIEDIINRADAAMYEAKARGKNCCVAAEQ